MLMMRVLDWCRRLRSTPRIDARIQNPAARVNDGRSAAVASARRDSLGRMEALRISEETNRNRCRTSRLFLNSKKIGERIRPNIKAPGHVRVKATWKWAWQSG